MKMTLRKIGVIPASIIVWCGICAFNASAQQFDIGANLLVGLPQGEFRDNVTDNGIGGSGQIGVYLGNTPIMIGADIGIMNYGTVKRRESLSNTIPEIIVDVRTTNNIFMLHGFARIQPQNGQVRPYFEGLWGFKYLFTRTSIKEHWYEETIASSTNFDDFAESWGIGTGVDIGIWGKHRRRFRQGQVFNVSLNLSVKYLWGSEAEYLKKYSIIYEPDGGVTYLVMRSRTDMFIPQIGIRMRF